MVVLSPALPATPGPSPDASPHGELCIFFCHVCLVLINTVRKSCFLFAAVGASQSISEYLCEFGQLSGFLPTCTIVDVLGQLVPFTMLLSVVRVENSLRRQASPLAISYVEPFLCSAEKRFRS